MFCCFSYNGNTSVKMRDLELYWEQRNCITLVNRKAARDRFQPSGTFFSSCLTHCRVSSFQSEVCDLQARVCSQEIRRNPGQSLLCVEGHRYQMIYSVYTQPEKSVYLAPEFFTYIPGVKKGWRWVWRERRAEVTAVVTQWVWWSNLPGQGSTWAWGKKNSSQLPG